MISYIVSFRESSYPPAITGKTKIIKTYFVEHASLSNALPPSHPKKTFLGRRRHLLFTSMLFPYSQAFATTERDEPVNPSSPSIRVWCFQNKQHEIVNRPIVARDSHNTGFFLGENTNRVEL